MSLTETLAGVARALRNARASTLAPGDLARLQDRRLRALLEHAARHSPFYRERLAGLETGTCAMERIPVTTRQEFSCEFDRMVTDPSLKLAEVTAFMSNVDNTSRLYRDRYALCHTSGSQGAPVTVVTDLHARQVFFSLQAARSRRLRSTLGEILRRLTSPFRLAVIGMRRGFYPSNAVWQHIPDNARRFYDVLRLAPTDPDLVEQLNAFRPHAITAYASVLDGLGMARDRLRLQPHLTQVVSNSESLTPSAQMRFRSAFGVPVLDNYSMAECNHLSSGCPEGGVHVNADWAILEVVDEQDRPVLSGTPGAGVLLTNLANFVQPVIRYRIGDRVTPAGAPCSCGSRLPRLSAIDGRSSDFFWIRAEGTYRQVLHYVFKHALDAVPQVREWQASQVERNRVQLRLEPLPGAPLDLEVPLRLVREQLDSMGLAGAMELAAEVVERIRPDPRTGKLTRMHSRVGPPEDLEQAFRNMGTGIDEGRESAPGAAGDGWRRGRDLNPR